MNQKQWVRSNQFFLHGCIFQIFNDRDAIVGLWSLAGNLHLVKQGLKRIVDHVIIVEGRVDAKRNFVFLGNSEPPKKWNVASMLWDVVIVENWREHLSIRFNYLILLLKSPVCPHFTCLPQLNARTLIEWTGYTLLLFVSVCNSI